MMHKGGGLGATGRRKLKENAKGSGKNKNSGQDGTGLGAERNRTLLVRY